MAFLKTERGKLERVHIDELRVDDGVTGPPAVSDQVSYLDGDYKPQIMSFLVNRYARRIQKRKPDESGSTVEDVYFAELKMAPQAAIDNGLFEVVGTEFYQKIVRSAASLASNTEYVYVDGEGQEIDDEFGKDISMARAKGGFQQKLTRLDELSVGSGSSALMVQVLGSNLDYQPIPINNVWVVHGMTILDDGVERPTNTLDIEEASIVVVQLDSSASNNTYVAFFPRSDKYPQGRQVKYESMTWSNIPDPMGDGAIEALDDAGEINNPLTVIQDRAQDWTIPEIPVVIWIGTTKGIGSSLMPYDEALYNTCLELDLSLSRAFTSLNKSATGNLMFTSELGSSPIWADNLGEGVNMLRPGQSAIMLNLPPAGGEALIGAVERGGAMIGDSYGVATHELVASESATRFPSGEALVQAAQKSEAARQGRADINRAGMQRIFRIEKGLAAIDNDEPDYAAGIEQKWIVQPNGIAKTDEKRLMEAKLEMELKIKGQRELVREHVDGMEDATDEQVDEYIAELKLSGNGQPQLGRFTAAAQAAQ